MLPCPPLVITIFSLYMINSLSTYILSSKFPKFHYGFRINNISIKRSGKFT